MPDVYVEISRRVVDAPVRQLIHWAENNPVVAAFGAAHELEFSGKIPNIEWDVFLDPYLVQRIVVVIEAQDDYIKELRKESTIINNICTKSDGDMLEKIKSYLASQESMVDKKNTLGFFNAEIRK